MKKLIIITMILSLAFCLFACGKAESEMSTEAKTTIPPESTSSNKTNKPTDNTFTTVKPNPVQITIPKPNLAEGETYTGRKALPLVDFKVNDPDNERGISTEKRGYGFGVSKNAVPNQMSVANQKFYDDKGFNSFCLDTKTTEKVLYLTFDCGYENGYTAKILDTLKEKNVPSAFFCTLPQVKDYPELIARMINEGHIVGNHSIKHQSFPTLTRTQMMNEIKGMDDYLRTYFGYSEPFFRFPMGENSDNSIDLVGSLGYSCVFWSTAYSDWDLKAQKGADYAFDTVTSRLHPGAVILLHSVSPDNSNALGRIIDWAKTEGYTFKSLRDFPKQ